MTTVGQIAWVLDAFAPAQLKLDFDNVGLLVGRKDAPVTRVLTALDITPEVIDEAKALGAELIVSHHPVFFNIKKITDETENGDRVLRLIESDIAAICMHTNMDAAQGGVNDALLRKLGCENGVALNETDFIGRIGTLAHAKALPEFLAEIRSKLHTRGLRYYDAGRPVKKIACCGGAGGGELELAARAGCDTYVTADIKYDRFLTAEYLGINLIDADHFFTENAVVPVFKKIIEDAFPELLVSISQKHTCKIQFFE